MSILAVNGGLKRGSIGHLGTVEVSWGFTIDFCWGKIRDLSSCHCNISVRLWSVAAGNVIWKNKLEQTGVRSISEG